jgi:hypothetical protein
MKGRSIKKIAIACFASLALAGCVSLMEKTGRVLDGSAFKDKKVAQYRGEDMEVTLVQNKDTGRSVIISLNNFPMMFFRASEPDENGTFFLTSLEYLAGGIQSWNEYTLDLLGEGTLSFDESAVIALTGEIEPVQISAGRIHRYDTRITGNEALTGLRNRRERIVATTEWMAKIEGAPKGQSIDDFEEYWKPVLFPEMVSKKKRPADWKQEGDLFIRAEDIRWNTGYTERVFSEELRPVRNSGTMLRDWEEALSWLYLEYEWENIKEKLSQKTTLVFYK